MTTRILEIDKPRFTQPEIRELCSGKAIEIFGVSIEHRAGNWFRLDAKNIQILTRVIGILEYY